MPGKLHKAATVGRAVWRLLALQRDQRSRLYGGDGVLPFSGFLVEFVQSDFGCISGGVAMRDAKLEQRMAELEQELAPCAQRWTV